MKIIFSFIIAFNLVKVKEINLRSWDYPKSVYISPDNKKVYVCNLEGENLLIIDREKKEIIKRISMKGKSVELDFSEGGQKVWVSLLRKNQAVVYDTLENRIIARIKVGKQPKIIRISPDENMLFVQTGIVRI